MKTTARPIRIEPAFDDREAVCALFYRHAPYAAAAAYLPDGSDESGGPRAPDAVRPWFRSTWALGGEPRVDGAEVILHSRRFLAAARAAFGSARIEPRTVVVNVNAPMPAGVPHVDVPSFRGATREHYALKLLIAMGASGLFERWRVVEAGAIAWFYDGPGGDFDYWPDGLDHPMRTERSPFGNVAIVADNDRMYHRIGAIGPANAALPRMTAAAEIRAESDRSWSIYDGRELRAHYDPSAVRLSVLWKAEVFSDEDASVLTADQTVETLRADLRARGVSHGEPANPLADPAWIALVYQTYAV